MRNKAIDILRGVGILAIVFIHVTAWYTSDKAAYLIWNWGQFAVPTFVFCSTYLFFVKKEKYSQEGFVNYSLSRLKRLLLPYYVFLVFYLLIFLIKNPASLSLLSLGRYLTLTTSGNDPSWAVLLFVYLTVLMFPLIYLWKNRRLLFVIYSITALASSIFFLTNNWAFNFKLIMWLPWSLVVLFSWFFAKYENEKGFFPLMILSSGSLFLSLWYLNDSLGSSAEFIRNKYPPNLYYLTYSLFFTTLIYFLAKKGVFDLAAKPINFLSINSYNIYFIHLILVIAFSEFMNIQSLHWGILFTAVLTLTILIQGMLGKLKQILIKNG